MTTYFGEADHANLYARFRPQYPPELYARIFQYLTGDGNISGNLGKLAFDVGCGTGQNTTPLAAYFEEVIGLDTSESQVAEARKAHSGLANVEFRCAAAEGIPLFTNGRQVDLITVATALHWFKIEEFYEVCQRGLRPGGVLAAFGYQTPRLYNDRAEQALHEFFLTTEKYLMPEVQHAMDRYKRLFASLQKWFPHSERDDSMKIELKLSIQEFCGLVSSFSFYQLFRKDNPESSDPAAELSTKLQDIYQAKYADKDVVTGCFEIYLLLAKKAS